MGQSPPRQPPGRDHPVRGSHGMGTGMVKPGTDGPLKPGDQPGRNCRSGLLEGQQNGTGQGTVVDGTGDGEGRDVY